MVIAISGVDSGGPGARVPRQVLVALAGLLIAVSTVGLNITIMTAALPTIAADLVVGASVLQWMANVYVLVPAAPMLVCGTPGIATGGVSCC